MKTKPADISYCDVKEDIIKKAKPVFNEEVLEYHHNYIFERHKIYKRKEIKKLPPPWTEDEIFQKYKFTNVRRELDRESKWLIKNITSNKKLSLEEKMAYCIHFRTINKSESIEKLNLYSYSIKELIDIDHIKPKIEEKMKSILKDYPWFGSAFFTSGFKMTWSLYKYHFFGDKTITLIHPDGTEEKDIIESRGEVGNPLRATLSRAIKKGLKIKETEENMIIRTLFFLKYVIEKGYLRRINKSYSQKEAFDIINEIPGMGGFLAYQVFVDFTYIKEFKFSENEFTVAGPGCQRGIDYMFKDKDGMNYEECIFWVRDNIEKEWKKRGWETDLNKLFDHLPEYDRHLNVMMLENSFCELSKYTKAKKEMGRPRVTYDYSKYNTCKLEEW